MIDVEKLEVPEVIELDMTTDKAAGMLAVAFMAERFLPEQFIEEGFEDVGIIQHYGGLISGLIFSELQEVYGKTESGAWEQIHKKAFELVDLLSNSFIETKYREDNGGDA